MPDHETNHQHRSTENARQNQSDLHEVDEIFVVKLSVHAVAQPARIVRHHDKVVREEIIAKALKLLFELKTVGNGKCDAESMEILESFENVASPALCVCTIQ